METQEAKAPVKSRAVEWNNKIGEIRSFAENNSSWPSTTSENVEEKRLAQWWSRQKYYFKKFESSEKAPGINDERASIIRNLLQSFATYERDGIWNARYNRVKAQVSNTGKLWSYKTEKETEEGKILRWFNQQKTFYRQWRRNDHKGGMTEARAQKIEAVLLLLGQPNATAETPSGTSGCCESPVSEPETSGCCGTNEIRSS